MTNTVQTAVVGVTGYAGAELARLLLRHPRLKGAPPVFAGRMDEKDAARGGVPLGVIHPQLADNNGSNTLKLEPFSWELLARRGVNVLFLATPHEQSREWVPEALKRGLRVIDLSGAWRLTSAANRAVYAFEDNDAELAGETQAQAVYGMPELHRAGIAGARLIANPGCYATSIILALRPLVAAGLAKSLLFGLQPSDPLTVACASLGSGPSHIQTAKVITETASTAGTKMAATLSARP